jgi:hypothetical protein
MSEDDGDRPLWRRLLLNRFVLVPGAIAAAILVWNLYVITHDNGIVEGRVVDARGEPVPDADVTLWVLNFTTFVEKARIATGPDGRFRFERNESHNIQLAAQKPGLGRSARIPVRLYFKAQDVAVPEPLRLVGG